MVQLSSGGAQMRTHLAGTIWWRIRGLVTLLPILTVVAAPAVAQESEWSFSHQSATPLDPPPWLQRDSLRQSLGYYDESSGPIRGFRADLNRDGTPDYVFSMSIDVCGRVCSYVLVDGRTRKRVGGVGGSALFVRARMINGYPVIEAYGHRRWKVGYWSVSVFDGRDYVRVGGVELEGASLERLFETLRDFSSWPPPDTSR